MNYAVTQICNNTLTMSGSIDNYSCAYHFDYYNTSNFVFYTIILPIVGIYLFFKFIRFVLDLFFN